MSNRHSSAVALTAKILGLDIHQRYSCGLDIHELLFTGTLREFSSRSRGRNANSPADLNKEPVLVSIPPLPPNAAMRWAIVNRIVRELAPVDILEIGCGQGAFGARLAAQTTYVAVEPDPASFAVARTRIEPAGGQVHNCSSGDLERDRTYDLVCVFEVLEHLEDDVAALMSWHELTKPGGHILLSMPAWQDRFNHWDDMVGHYRRYSPSQCRRVLNQAGFDQVEVIVYGWPLGFATENVRSRIAARRGAASEGATGGMTMQARTASSGRVLQPKAVAGIAIQVATVPFSALQRLRPTKGTGVVVLASRIGTGETLNGQSARQTRGPVWHDKLTRLLSRREAREKPT